MLLSLVPPWVNHPVKKKKITHAAIKEPMSSLLKILYVTMLKSIIPKRSMKFPSSSLVYTSDLKILSLHIPPSGGFNQFIKTVEGTLNIYKIHNLSYNLWCHQYRLSQSKLQEKLLTLLTTYNLSHRV